LGTPKDSEITKAAIIEAAGRLFAEKSFKSVSVREIISEADTHLSAMNYHFGSKDSLYLEVLKVACEVISTKDAEKEYFYSLDPETALFEIAKYTIESYFNHDKENWHFVIITREYWEPSNGYNFVVENYFKPENELLTNIIGKIVNKSPELNSIRFASISLIGLLETFGFYEKLINSVCDGLQDQGKRDNWYIKRIVKMVIDAARMPDIKSEDNLNIANKANNQEAML